MKLQFFEWHQVTVTSSVYFIYYKHPFLTSVQLYLSEYCQLHIIKVKAFDIYWVKALVTGFSLWGTEIFILLDFVYWLATPWWSLALLLSLCHPVGCLELVGFAATTPHLSICRALPLGVLTAIFVVLYHLFLIVPNIVMFLLVLSNEVKFLCISYIVQHLLFVCVLWASIIWAHINIWSLMCSLVFLRLFVPLLSLLLWVHHLIWDLHTNHIQAKFGMVWQISAVL